MIIANSFKIYVDIWSVFILNQLPVLFLIRCFHMFLSPFTFALPIAYEFLACDNCNAFGLYFGRLRMKKYITNEIYSAYLNCKYKAYLKICEFNGRRSEYERIETRLGGTYRENAICFIRKKHRGKVIASLPSSTLYPYPNDILLS